MLSVLIPTYNYDASALVDTIYNQLKTSAISFEIRIYDDASTYPLPRFENDERPEVIHKIFQQNKGRTATRQKLAQDAEYDWLLFLDADVIPRELSFIKTYLDTINETAKIIYGGVAYNDTLPKQDHMLRWVYGRSREMLTALERRKSPHNIISQNICIRKKTFLELNNNLSNRYGMDNLFSGQIKRQNIAVVHIDNPVIHLGLENNHIFLKKALQAVDTLILNERSKKIADDFTKLQKTAKNLKKYKLDGIYRLLTTPFVRTFKKNLLGQDPNLFFLDLYKLNYYLKKQRHYTNA